MKVLITSSASQADNNSGEGVPCGSLSVLAVDETPESRDVILGKLASLIRPVEDFVPGNGLKAVDSWASKDKCFRRKLVRTLSPPFTTGANFGKLPMSIVVF